MAFHLPSSFARQSTLPEDAPPTLRDTLRLVPQPPSPGRWLLVSVAYVLLHRLLLAGSMWLSLEEGYSLWYPPAGLDVALLVISGPWFVPTVILNQFLVIEVWLGADSFLGGMGWGWTLVYTLGQGIVYGGVVSLLLTSARCNARLRTVRDVSFFLGVMVLIAPFLLGLWKMGVLEITGRMDAEAFWPQVLAYTIGDGTGIGMLVPVLVVALRPFPALWWDQPLRPSEGYQRVARPAQLLEGGLLTVVSLGLAWLIFIGRAGAALEFSYVLFLPVLWLAVRYGMEGAALGALGVNVTTAFIVAPSDIAGTNPYAVQLGMLMVTLVGLFLGAYVSSRRRTRALLERALARAEQLDAMKQTMLLNLSHELRTPLTMALGAVEILHEEAPPDHRPLTSDARTAITTLTDTLDQVVDLTRLGTGDLAVVLGEVDLGEIARRSADDVTAQAATKHLRVVIDTPSHPVRVVADEDLLQRALRPVLENAFAYTDAGTVTLRVAQEDDTGTLAVADTGRGIEAARMATLFETFAEEGDGYRRRHDGLGIGLALTHGLVEAQGGWVSATSTLGVGSTFTLRFPLASSPEPAVPSPHPAAAPHA